MKAVDKFIESKKFTTIKIIFIAILFLVLLSKVDISKVVSNAIKVPRILLFGAITTSILAVFFQGLSWKVLIDQKGEIYTWNAVKARISLIFINHLIPARSGRLIAPSLISSSASNISLSNGIPISRLNTLCL